MYIYTHIYYIINISICWLTTSLPGTAAARLSAPARRSAWAPCGGSLGHPGAAGAAGVNPGGRLGGKLLENGWKLIRLMENGMKVDGK